MAYKIIYFFDSDTHSLFEIKNEDIKTEDKSKVYFWILYDKITLNIIHLSFVSMSSYERIFKEGKLIFDISEIFDATLLIDNKKIQLKRQLINIIAYNSLINILSNDILEKDKKIKIK